MLPNKALTTIDTAAQSKAAFGQITIPVTATLRLIGGLRYTTDERTCISSTPTYDGATLPHSPEWNLDVGYRHSWILGNGGTLTGSLDARYTSESYVNVSQDAASLQKAYTIGDASIGFASSDERWSVSAYVKNMTDEPVKTGRFGPNVTLGAPRTYGVVLSSRF